MVDGMICGYQAGGFRRQEDTVCAGEYKGKAEWWVTRGSTVLRVRAQSPQAAIKAALEHWGLDWRSMRAMRCTATTPATRPRRSGGCASWGREKRRGGYGEGVYASEPVYRDRRA